MILAEMRIPLNHIQTLPADKFLPGSQVNAQHDEAACECVP